MITRCSVALLCIVAFAVGLPATQDDKNSVQTETDILDGIYHDCIRKDSISCVKFKLFSFVDKILSDKDTITVTEGVQIVKTEAGEPEGAPRAFSADDTIESLIINRVQRFLNTHSIKINLKGKDILDVVTNTARSFSDTVETLNEDDEDNGALTEEGRGRRKKKRRMMGTMMAAIALKMAFMSKMALAGIALIAGKALLIGKMALVLSAIIGLKKLFGGQGKHVTYEVVAHPHSSGHGHDSSGGSGGFGDGGGGGYGSSGHGGWGRSIEAQKLAYKNQLPGQEDIKYH